MTTGVHPQEKFPQIIRTSEAQDPHQSISVPSRRLGISARPSWSSRSPIAWPPGWAGCTGIWEGAGSGLGGCRSFPQAMLKGVSVPKWPVHFVMSSLI